MPLPSPIMLMGPLLARLCPSSVRQSPIWPMTPAVTVGEHSAGYLLRSIAVELGKKAEEEEKKK